MCTVDLIVLNTDATIIMVNKDFQYFSITSEYFFNTRLIDILHISWLTNSSVHSIGFMHKTEVTPSRYRSTG